MRHVLENENILVAFTEKGAEMTSLLGKENQIEYLWQGDPTFWGRQAPILFPFVGRLKEDQYFYDGQTYSMGQHGFARDQQFTLVHEDETQLIFELKSTNDTKKSYPFDFTLRVIYKLLPEGVDVHYQVINTDEKELLFSIGAHPAFNVPLEKGYSFEDYYLHFSPQKSRLTLPLVGPYIDYENRTIGQTNTDIQLKRELFKNDALVYETPNTNRYTICTEDSSASVTVSYKDMPYVGIWSPYPAEAPFVCIEPWYGVADTIDATGVLEEKRGIQKLAPQQQFDCSYLIEITQ